LQHIDIKQAATLHCRQEIATKCDLFISQYVNAESKHGDPIRAEFRRKRYEGIPAIDGASDEVIILAEALMKGHAVPVSEATDAVHIATAARRSPVET
jgi:hypothetical protein